MGFQSNSKFNQHLECSSLKYSQPVTKFLHTSRQLHCREVCKISLWSVEYISNKSTANFGGISISIEIKLVGRVLADIGISDKDLCSVVIPIHAKIKVLHVDYLITRLVTNNQKMTIFVFDLSTGLTIVMWCNSRNKLLIQRISFINIALLSHKSIIFYIFYNHRFKQFLRFWCISPGARGCNHWHICSDFNSGSLTACQ